MPTFNYTNTPERETVGRPAPLRPARLNIRPRGTWAGAAARAPLVARRSAGIWVLATAPAPATAVSATVPVAVTVADATQTAAAAATMGTVAALLDAE